MEGGEGEARRGREGGQDGGGGRNEEGGRREGAQGKRAGRGRGGVERRCAGNGVLVGSRNPVMRGNKGGGGGEGGEGEGDGRGGEGTAGLVGGSVQENREEDVQAGSWGYQRACSRVYG